MNKMLLFLVVVGVLLIGTFAMAEELSESSCERGEFSEGEDLGDATPCGGGSGGGPGGAPGSTSIPTPCGGGDGAGPGGLPGPQ